MKRTMKKTPNKIKLIRNAAALARKLGKNHGTLSRWIASESWTFGAGPWPMDVVDKIREWERAESKKRHAESAEIRRLRREKLAADLAASQARLRRNETEFKIRMKKLIDVDDVCAIVGRFSAAVSNINSRLVAEFPVIKERLEDLITVVTEEFDREFRAMLPPDMEISK